MRAQKRPVFRPIWGEIFYLIYVWVRRGRVAKPDAALGANSQWPVDCVDHRQDRATAALVGFSALPFFGVALSALLQSPDTDTQVSFVPRRGGAGLQVGGTF